MPEGTCEEAPRYQVARAIRQFRGDETQKSLATRAKVRPATLSAIETAATSARIDTLGKIAAALGKPLEALLGAPVDQDTAA